jgi:hypothetical protein
MQTELSAARSTILGSAGRDGANGRTKSSWLLPQSILAGANMALTVAVQINQRRKTSFANDVNAMVMKYLTKP